MTGRNRSFLLAALAAFLAISFAPLSTALAGPTGPMTQVTLSDRVIDQEPDSRDAGLIGHNTATAVEAWFGPGGNATIYLETGEVIEFTANIEKSEIVENEVALYDPDGPHGQGGLPPPFLNDGKFVTDDVHVDDLFVDMAMVVGWAGDASGWTMVFADRSGDEVFAIEYNGPVTNGGPFAEVLGNWIGGDDGGLPPPRWLEWWEIGNSGLPYDPNRILEIED